MRFKMLLSFITSIWRAVLIMCKMTCLKFIKPKSNCNWFTFYSDKSCNMKFYSTCRSTIWLGRQNYNFCAVYPHTYRHLWHKQIMYSLFVLIYDFWWIIIIDILTLNRRLLCAGISRVTLSFDSALFTGWQCWKRSNDYH